MMNVQQTRISQVHQHNNSKLVEGETITQSITLLLFAVWHVQSPMPYPFQSPHLQFSGQVLYKALTISLIIFHMTFAKPTSFNSRLYSIIYMIFAKPTGFSSRLYSSLFISIILLYPLFLTLPYLSYTSFLYLPVSILGYIQYYLLYDLC